MIKSFDKVNCKELSADIMKALEEVGKKYNVNIKRGNGRFSSTNFTFKLEIATKTENGEVNDKEAVDFKNNAYRYGLSGSDLGRKFEDHEGRMFRIVGLRIKSYKYPIIVQDVITGQKYKYSATIIARYLKNVS